MNEQEVDLLRRIEENTREIAEWLQLAYGERLKERLEVLLFDDKRKLAYESSTDDSSSRSVAARAGVGDKTVRDWWAEWAEAGIVEETETSGRFKRKYDLKRLGVTMPRAIKA